MKDRLAALIVAVFALGLIIGAAFLSHSWGDEKEGLDSVYVILALVVLALAIPSVRRWLREATQVKLPGGFEITRQVEDAVAAAATLPDADESLELKPGDKAKILREDWRGDPKSALGKLQAVLSKRLNWINRELGEDPRRTDLESIAKLKEQGLINPPQARLLQSLNEISGAAVERDFAKGGETKEAMVRFLENADRTVSRIRLIVLDRKVRRSLEEEGFSIMDIGGQPQRRWPDFYVFDRSAPDAVPLRAAVRVATLKKSKLIKDARKRLRKTKETPLDAEAQKVIVIPRISKTNLGPAEFEIPAFRREAFMEWVRSWRAGAR